jgi:DNA-binding HxlR family transcriptional regulator
MQRVNTSGPSSYDSHMAVRVATGTAPAALDAPSASERRECCTYYHRAVELIGKRWTGAIILVLMDGPLRFSEVRQLVPDLSDRLLSERMKELEGEGIVERRVIDETPVRVEYELTEKGRALEPVVSALKHWARDWIEA